MSGRSGRGRWVLVLLCLALVTGVVAAPTWVTAGGTSVLTGTVAVHVPGTRAAPGLIGAALALAAAGVALALAGRVGRWLVVAVVLACGALVVWSAAGVLRNPEPAARQAVAAATGVDHVVAPVSLTAAPWLAAVAGVVVLCAGLVLARSSARWAGPSRRHELGSPVEGVASAPSSPAPGTAVDDGLGTVGAPGAGPSAADASGSGSTMSGTSAFGATTAGAAGADPTDERAAWDALSRGEDPT